MPLSDLLRLADTALSSQPNPQLPEELLRALVEETGSRAGVLRSGGGDVARWPRTVSRQVEEATEGWCELPFGGDLDGWSVHLLQLGTLDESVLAAARLGLRAWRLRDELKRTRFDARFHLWELEAIRAIAGSIGGILEPERVAEELINHLVALLGVRSAHLYLGDDAATATSVGAFGPPVIDRDRLAEAWEHGFITEEVAAIPLETDGGTLGVLVAAHKEAREGTEPFAANDIRLLELFAVQVTVAMEYVRLTLESLERERLRNELETAAVIQSHLYPQRFPDVEGYRLVARATPSRHVAGDTYDALGDGESLVVTVTDVSGKGVGAGMIASGVHAAVRLLAGNGLGPAELARRINLYLAGATADNRFATFAMARLEPDGRLVGVNAGHCPMLIRRADGRVDEIASSGFPLGMMGFAEYSEHETRLEPGDLLVLYTDGLTEAEDPDEEEFGVERVAEVVSKLGDVTAESACSALLEAVERHTHGAPLIDDATLVVVERLAR
ncbi:MAG: SpoIIE family protein phosphatase [Thermoanaerobaculales bacterium]|jgi:serine phosphatase RsbU (regulator of sigma subunit)|nr:SpoIIE family protein phosphatase [Thermoanaerobaculales bacterium]